MVLMAIGSLSVADGGWDGGIDAVVDDETTAAAADLAVD